MEQKGFLFNPNRCLGCRACQVACAADHGLSQGTYLRKVMPVEFVKDNYLFKYFLSSSCNHCENPECFRVCPEHAYRKRRDGTVIIDQKKCQGCGTCTRGCPFQAPVINPMTGKVIKCDFCYGRIEEGKDPICVASCPVDAIQLLKYPPAADSTPTLQKNLPGVPRVQLTRPAVRYIPLKTGRQIGMQITGSKGVQHV